LLDINIPKLNNILRATKNIVISKITPTAVPNTELPKSIDKVIEAVIIAINNIRFNILRSIEIQVVTYINVKIVLETLSFEYIFVDILFIC